MDTLLTPDYRKGVDIEILSQEILSSLNKSARVFTYYPILSSQLSYGGYDHTHFTDKKNNIQRCYIIDKWALGK